MADINTATIVGHLVKDEDLKYTSGGMAIGNITIAINRKVKKGEEWIDESNFFDVTIFGKQAESLKLYLTKGKQVGVTGWLKQERWTDQQSGQNRSKVVIVASDVQLLGGKDNNNGSGNSYQHKDSYNESYGYGN